MNDFETRLAQQTFREPPQDLRRLILAAGESAPRPNWREWLWPSPAAWGVLAALWLIFGALEAVETRSNAAPRALADGANVPTASSLLLTAHTPLELRRVLDLTN